MTLSEMSSNWVPLFVPNDEGNVAHVDDLTHIKPL